MLPAELSAYVRDVPDFPKPGIVFKDITPLLADATALAEAVRLMVEPHADSGVTKVVGIEARGFIFAAPMALTLGAGFVPLRKAGKLPHATLSKEYDLEYGTATLEIHADAIGDGDRVLLVDDVLATGGTAAAAMELIGSTGAEVVGLAFLLEIEALGGAGALRGIPHCTLLAY